MEVSFKVVFGEKNIYGSYEQCKGPTQKKCTARKRTSQTEARVCLDTAYYWKLKTENIIIK